MSSQIYTDSIRIPSHGEFLKQNVDFEQCDYQIETSGIDQTAELCELGREADAYLLCPLIRISWDHSLRTTK